MLTVEIKRDGVLTASLMVEQVSEWLEVCSGESVKVRKFSVKCTTHTDGQTYEQGLTDYGEFNEDDLEFAGHTLGAIHGARRAARFQNSDGE